MTRRRRATRGFTLLEMLVASIGAALLAAAVYASLHAAFSARHTAEANLEPVRAARLALELVGHDLSGALPPNGLLAGPFSGQDRTDSAGRPADVVSFYGTADGGVQLQGFGDVQQVVYSFEDEADVASGASTLASLGVSTAGGAGASSSSSGSNSISSRSGMGLSASARTGLRQNSGPTTQRLVLVRRAIHNLLPTYAVEPEPQVLCRNVVGFNLAYYDGSGTGTWEDTWDSTATNNTAPLAVEVTLDIELPAPTNAGGMPIGEPTKYTLRRVFRLPCGQVDSGDVTATGGSTGGSTGGGGGGGGGGGTRGGS